MRTPTMEEEFLRFSEMLDTEDTLDEQGLNEDGELLLELRQVLRQDDVTPGNDFTFTTANLVRQRFAGLPWQERLVMKSAPLMLRPAKAPTSLMMAGGLAGLGGLSWLAWRPLGWLLLSLSLLVPVTWLLVEWRLQERFSESLEGGATSWLTSWSRNLGRAGFYAPPILAGLAFSLLVGSGVGAAFQAPAAGLGGGLLTVAFLIWCLRELGDLYRATVSQGSGILTLHHSLCFGLTMAFVLLADQLGDTVDAVPLWFTPQALLFGGPAEADFGPSWLLSGALVWTACLVLTWRFPDPTLTRVVSSRIRSIGELASGLVFYLLPVGSLVAAFVFTGFFVQRLGEVSLSFRKEETNVGLWALICSMAMFTLLSLAFGPYWKAWRAHHGRSWWRVLMFQSGWGVVLALLGNLVRFAQMDTEFTSHKKLGLINASIPLTLHSLILALSIAALITLLVQKLPSPTLTKVELRVARRRCLMALLRPLVPIGFCLAVFYQLHLTREIQQPEVYRQSRQEVERWVAERMSIPDEENGYLELRHFLVLSEIEAGGDLTGIAQRLRGLGQFNGLELFENRGLNPEERKNWTSAKAEFLAELPRLRKAMEKPEFSYLKSEGGLSYESQVPNFILFRAVSQGLELLALEALWEKNPADAVDSIEFGLRWATKDDCPTLIGLMIKIAQLHIILNPIEKLLHESELSAEQLARLSQALAAAQLPEEQFHQVMLRDVYTFEKLVGELKEGKHSMEDVVNAGLPIALAFLPDSYLESERKAYINHQILESESQLELARPQARAESELNPMNVSQTFFAPATSRAQAQFMVTRSRISINRLMVALEQHKLAHGSYPGRLEQLVPEFLTELPVDTAHPARLSKKLGFGYRIEGQGYRLTSESPVYEIAGMKPRQVMGDGDYKTWRE